MIRTQIQLTERQAALIREAAAEWNVSMAEAIRRAVDQWLEERTQPDSEERRHRALKAAGRFRSGHASTAKDHDAALAEAQGR